MGSQNQLFHTYDHAAVPLPLMALQRGATAPRWSRDRLGAECHVLEPLVSSVWVRWHCSSGIVLPPGHLRRSLSLGNPSQPLTPQIVGLAVRYSVQVQRVRGAEHWSKLGRVCASRSQMSSVARELGRPVKWMPSWRWAFTVPNPIPNPISVPIIPPPNSSRPVLGT